MEQIIGTVCVPVVLAIAALLVNVSSTLGKILARLDAICERQAKHEERTEANIQRVHTRIDEVENKLIATGGRR